MNPGDEASNNSDTFNKGGSSGSLGVDFQLGLLSVALLNAFKLLKDWKLSTENTDAGKFDDLVLKSSNGNVLLQAKHKENQLTITLDDFISTDKNKDQFYLPKYFNSYIQDIRDTFKPANIIICTNADFDDELKQHLEPVTDLSKSILYYPGATFLLYSFKNTFVQYLKNIIRNTVYYKYNRKLVTDDNMKQFLDKLQVCCKYPSGETMENAIEQVLSNSKYSTKSPYGQVIYLEMYASIKKWYQEKPGKVHYLNDIRTKAMFFDIWREKYFQKLSQHNVSFQSNILHSLKPKYMFHFVTDSTYLSQQLIFLEELKVLKKNVLCLPSDVDAEIWQGITEVFKQLKKYRILFIVFPKTSNSLAVNVSESLQQTVESEDKKVILLSASLPQSSQRKTVKFASILKQISLSSPQELLDEKIVNFQGYDVTLKELLGSGVSNLLKELGPETLDNLIRNREIKVGFEVAPVEPYYINREFIRKDDVYTEDSIFKIPEKMILISDGAGYGKTTVLKKLASVIKKKYPHLWIIMIEANEYTDVFENLLKKRKNVDIAQLLHFNDLERLVFSNQDKVVLMIDAVDEISPHYTKIILNLLRRCKQAPNFKKIYVTTRSHITEELEEVLEVDGFQLQPFKETNQIDFLTKYWAHNLKLTDAKIENCKRYAKLLLKKLALWITPYSDDSVAVVPLQVRMLGEIIQQIDSKFADKKVPELPEMDIAQLYQMFVKKKRYIFVNKGNPGGNIIAKKSLKEHFKVLLRSHENLALELMFGDTVCKFFTAYQEFNVTTGEHVFKMGILRKATNEIAFVHRTFAEYFSAKRLLDELQAPNKGDELRKYFTKDILGNNTYIVVRAFIENFLNSTEYRSPANIFSFDVPVRSNLIHILAREGLFNILSILFNQLKSKTYNVSNEGITNKTLLHYAAEDGNEEITEKTPLHYAAEGGHLEIVELLLARGADINSLDITGNTPLHWAVEGSHLETVRCFFENERNVVSLNAEIILPLYYACSRGHINVVELLIQKGADINSSDISGRTLLHAAAHEGHIHVVRLLIDTKADINSSDIKGNTPLHEAALEGHLEVVQYLIDKNVHVHSLNEAKHSPLHNACSRRHINVIELLIKNGAKIYSSDTNSNTPFL